MLKIKGLLVLILLPALPALSQNNYWSQQFGAKSALMSGAVVAGVTDNSALYYNPGALGFIESSNLNVSATVYGLDIVNLKNAVGDNLDFNSLRPVIYPQLVSGVKRFKTAPKVIVAYGLITRSKTDFRFQAEYETTTNVIQNSPGNEYYFGQTEFTINSLEQWGGVAVAYRFNSKFSLGATTFVNYLHLDDRNYTFLSADGIQDSTHYSTSISELASHTIDNFSMLWKIGACLNLGQFKMGLTFTTPSINLFGFGKMSRSVEAYNMDKYLTPDDVIFAAHSSFILTDQQKKLNTQFKTAPSIALGFEYTFKKPGTRLGITSEVFFGIKEYEVLRGKDQATVRPEEEYGGQIVPNFLVAKTSSVPVINVALGLEQRLNDKFSLFLGARTDFNSTVNLLGTAGAGGSSLNPTYWHFMHFNLGAMYKKGSSDLTVGINYGYGITNNRRQIINLTSPKDIYISQGATYLLQGEKSDNMAANVHSPSLIVGYTYYIKR